MACLRRELERLSELEGDCVQKDDLIDQLREEVTNLQNFVRHIEVDRCPMCQKNTAAGGTVSASPQATAPPPVLHVLFHIQRCILVQRVKGEGQMSLSASHVQ